MSVKVSMAFGAITAVWLSFPLVCDAEVIKFTHTDPGTDYTAITGGGFGHTLSILMDNGGSGTVGQSWGAGNFLSATFTSGGYTATYSSPGTMIEFVTDALGAVISSSFDGVSGDNGADSLAGLDSPAIQPTGMSGDFRILPSDGSSGVFTSQPDWSDPMQNLGWSVAPAGSAAVPEPSSLILLAAGLVGAIGYRCRPTK